MSGKAFEGNACRMASGQEKRMPAKNVSTPISGNIPIEDKRPTR
jgi:hypothetical protein